MSYRKFYKRGPFSIGASHELPTEAQQELVACFQGYSESGGGGLAGRAPVRYVSIDGIGPVVIKQYARGGMLRHLRSSVHLRTGRVRSEREFEVLEKVRALGISVPEPIAYAWRGRRFYRAWLVTRQIPGHRTLAEVSREDENKARALAKQLVPMVEVLVRNGVFHIDLHPGNVVVDAEGRLYLLDFDKARMVVGREHELLAERYLCRWRRAVIKHQLSEVLTEVLCSALRRRDLVVSSRRRVLR